MEDKSSLFIKNIKQEPEVEFTIVLKPFQPERNLKGDVNKIEDCDAETEDIGKSRVKSLVKSIQRSKNKSKPYICDFCERTFVKRNSLVFHLHQHIKPFKCECGKSFGTTGHLNKHKVTHDKNRTTFNCMLCSSTYKDKIGLRRHLDVHHFTIGEKFKCDECDYEGKSKEYLKNHQKTHTKPFKCNKCEKRFSINQLLKTHLKRHDGPDEFVCPCSRVFKSSESLNKHKSKIHKAGEPIEIDDGTFNCKVCLKQLNTKAHLKGHMKTHEEKQKCKICSKIVSASTLDAHIRAHKVKESEKQFECQKCSKYFFTANDLKFHKKTHEEKQKCPICSAMLTVLSLKHHMRQHELKKGEKKFKCSECSSAFFTSMQLKMHLRIHKKPFACDLCGQRFASKQQIRSHVMRRHFVE